VLQEIIDCVVIDHNAEVGHTDQIFGELMRMLGAADSKNAATYEAAACSLQLVAGRDLALIELRGRLRLNASVGIC
jgi:hypothetical protein